MIQNDTPRYRERLLAELRALAEQNAAAAPRGGHPVRRRRPRLIAAGAAGGACVATALVVLAGTDDGSPAYAVEPRDDGSVTVEISKLEDAAGLERALRAAGVPAEVDYLAPGKTCREGRFEPARTGRFSANLSQRDDGSISFTVGAGDLRPGQTLVMMTSGTTRGPASIGVAIAQGAVAPCVAVDAPTGERALPDPAPASGADGMSLESAGGTTESEAPNPGVESGGE
jgi:hypothetical protein